MAIFFYSGEKSYEIGSPDFLYAFFSTVSYRLENGKWGTRFPFIMNELYSGSLSYTNAAAALKELEIISGELRAFSPDKVVWDQDDLDAQPPWGNNISPDIASLSDYFVTSAGEDLTGVIRSVLKASLQNNKNVEIG